MNFTHLGRTGLRVSRLCLGTMNFGPETDEPTSFAIMDRAHERRNQLLRLGQRLRSVEGTRRYRGDRGSLVRARRRPAGPYGAGDQAVREHGGLAQRGSAVCAQYSPGLRRFPAAAADRLHRPLPDAPHRQAHAVGRDLGSHGGAAIPGQDPLRRVVQLRRMAHRQSAGRGARSASSWAW